MVMFVNIVLFIGYYFSNSPEHHAYADVAMCLEENDTEQYAGKFKY